MTEHLQRVQEHLHFAERELERTKAAADQYRRILRECIDFVTAAERAGIKAPDALADEIPF